MEERKHYVYKHIREDKNEVFYIGIGSTKNYKRAYQKYKRNNIWKLIAEKTSYKVEILMDNISFEEACENEIKLIKIYGRIDKKNGTLANLTDGGEGTLNREPWNKGIPCSEDKKNKISIYQKANPSKGFEGWKHTNESKEKISKTRVKKKILCINNGIIYDSINEAANKLNLHRGNISAVCRNIKKLTGGYKFRFI